DAGHAVAGGGTGAGRRVGRLIGVDRVVRPWGRDVGLGGFGGRRLLHGALLDRIRRDGALLDRVRLRGRDGLRGGSGLDRRLGLRRRTGGRQVARGRGRLGPAAAAPGATPGAEGDDLCVSHGRLRGQGRPRGRPAGARGR